MIPILKTLLPTNDRISKYINLIDQNRIYTNFGPLHNNLTQKLANYYSCKTDNILLTSSGTSSLMSIILYYKYLNLSDSKDFHVIIPNWTFPATVQSVIALGCTPILLDVDPNTGILDINLVRDFFNSGNNCDLIMPVIPYGNAFDYDDWLNISTTFKVPCCIDGAAAFYSIDAIDIPICVSMHATKGMSSGEGGFVISSDSEFISNLKMTCNFGFKNSRVPSNIGLNLKLSEYHSAVGLASFETHQKFIEDYSNQFKEYKRLFKELLPEDICIFTDDCPKSTFSIVNKSSIKNSELIYKCFTEHGFEVRPWWGLAISQTPISVYCKQWNSMEHSINLGQKVIGLPMGEHINFESQAHIASSIHHIINSA